MIFFLSYLRKLELFSMRGTVVETHVFDPLGQVLKKLRAVLAPNRKLSLVHAEKRVVLETTSIKNSANFFLKPVDVLFVLVPSLEGDSRAEWTLVVVVVAHPAVVLVQHRLGVVLVAAAHAHVLLLAFVLHVLQECRLLPVD